MDTPHITPDQLRALANEHPFSNEVITRVYARVAMDHNNPVAGTHLILRQARAQECDPIDLAMRRPVAR